MGTWGVGSFDNDTAADWAITLGSGGGMDHVKRALDDALNVDLTAALPADVAECAIAAAEVVARLHGSEGVESPYSEPADRWIQVHNVAPESKLLRRAAAVVDRVAAAPSELADLWDESGDGQAWREEMSRLQSRLL
jgi:Domain of unknown function (DUF4259)